MESFGRAGINAGEFTLPSDVASDGDGGLYVTDSTGVAHFTLNGEFIRHLDNSDLPQAEGVASDPDGNVYVVGYGALIHKFSPQGAYEGTLGDAGTDPGQLRTPRDIIIDKDNRLLVADAGNRRVSILSSEGEYLGFVGEPGEQKGQFTAPWVLAMDGDDQLYVGQADDFLVQTFFG